MEPIVKNLIDEHFEEFRYARAQIQAYKALLYDLVNSTNIKTVQEFLDSKLNKELEINRKARQVTDINIFLYNLIKDKSK